MKTCVHAIHDTSTTQIFAYIVNSNGMTILNFTEVYTGVKYIPRGQPSDYH